MFPNSLLFPKYGERKHRMTTLPHLTVADVKAYIPDPYFGRGEEYYHSGHVFDTVQRGEQIEGLGF